MCIQCYRLLEILCGILIETSNCGILTGLPSTKFSLMGRAMTTRSLSFSGQGKIQENIPFPTMSMSPLWWVSNYWRTIPSPDIPAPAITTLPAWSFWVRKRLQQYKGSRSVFLHHPNIPTADKAWLSSIQKALSSSHFWDTTLILLYSFSKMPGSFWSMLGARLL